MNRIQLLSLLMLVSIGGVYAMERRSSDLATGDTTRADDLLGPVTGTTTLDPVPGGSSAADVDRDGSDNSSVNGATATGHLDKVFSSFNNWKLYQNHKTGFQIVGCTLAAVAVAGVATGVGYGIHRLLKKSPKPAKPHHHHPR